MISLRCGTPLDLLSWMISRRCRDQTCRCSAKEEGRRKVEVDRTRTDLTKRSCLKDMETTQHQVCGLLLAFPIILILALHQTTSEIHSMTVDHTR